MANPMAILPIPTLVTVAEKLASREVGDWRMRRAMK